MKIIGTQVKHITLGSGVVTEYTGQYIIVQFQNKCAKFIFPDAFEHFLTATDMNAQSEIMVIIGRSIWDRALLGIAFVSKRNKSRSQ